MREARIKSKRGRTFGVKPNCAGDADYTLIVLSLPSHASLEFRGRIGNRRSKPRLSWMIGHVTANGATAVEHDLVYPESNSTSGRKTASRRASSMFRRANCGTAAVQFLVLPLSANARATVTAASAKNVASEPSSKWATL